MLNKKKQIFCPNTLYKNSFFFELPIIPIYSYLQTRKLRKKSKQKYFSDFCFNFYSRKMFSKFSRKKVPFFLLKKRLLKASLAKKRFKNLQLLEKPLLFKKPLKKVCLSKRHLIKTYLFKKCFKKVYSSKKRFKKVYFSKKHSKNIFRIFRLNLFFPKTQKGFFFRKLKKRKLSPIKNIKKYFSLLNWFSKSVKRKKRRYNFFFFKKFKKRKKYRRGRLRKKRWKNLTKKEKKKIRTKQKGKFISFYGKKAFLSKKSLKKGRKYRAWRKYLFYRYFFFYKRRKKRFSFRKVFKLKLCVKLFYKQRQKKRNSR